MNMSQQYLTYLNDLYTLRSNILSSLDKYQELLISNQTPSKRDEYREIISKLKNKLFEIDKDILIRLDIIKE